MNYATAPVAALLISALTITRAPVTARPMSDTVQHHPHPRVRRRIARVPKNVAGQRAHAGTTKPREDVSDAEFARLVDVQVRKFEDSRGMTRARFQDFCFKKFKEQAD